MRRLAWPKKRGQLAAPTRWLPAAAAGGPPPASHTHRVLGGLVSIVRPLLRLCGAGIALQLVSSGETPGRKGAQELLLDGLAKAAGCGEGHGCVRGWIVEIGWAGNQNLVAGCRSPRLGA
jgi:hypothetical protein